jgi:hypothetical protein
LQGRAQARAGGDNCCLKHYNLCIDAGSASNYNFTTLLSRSTCFTTSVLI